MTTMKYYLCEFKYEADGDDHSLIVLLNESQFSKINKHDICINIRCCYGSDIAESDIVLEKYKRVKEKTFNKLNNFINAQNYAISLIDSLTKYDSDSGED